MNLLTSLILVISLLVVLVFLIYIAKLNLEKELREKDKFLSALHKLYGIMVSLVTLEETAQKLTDAIAFELGFQAGVLSLIDDKTGTLKRVAVSHTPAGLIGIRMLPVPYKAIGIPLDYYDNIIIRAIHEKKPQVTKRMYDLFTPRLQAALVDRLQRLMNIKTSFIYPIFSKDKVIGAMIFSISGDEKEISPSQKESIRRIIDVVGLVIDRVYLYEELARTSKSLEQANLKLRQLDKLKDDFVSVTSHELRTPMTAIRSYAWMALNKADINLTEKMKKYLSRVIVSTDRLINLVNDMLNVSRIEAGKIEINPRAFDINELVNEVIDEVRPRALERGITLFVMADKILRVFADEDKVHEVLLNLVGNSLKFTQSGETITISFFSDGQVVETSVRDTGSGIAQEDLSRLFQKFGRLDNSYVSLSSAGGTGLGLYISKSLIELMHGKIWVKSEGLGKGATFTFSLPLASQEVLREAKKYQIRAEGEAKELEPVAI